MNNTLDHANEAYQVEVSEHLIEMTWAFKKAYGDTWAHEMDVYLGDPGTDSILGGILESVYDEADGMYADEYFEDGVISVDEIGKVNDNLLDTIYDQTTELCEAFYMANTEGWEADLDLWFGLPADDCDMGSTHYSAIEYYSKNNT